MARVICPGWKLVRVLWEHTLSVPQVWHAGIAILTNPGSQTIWHLHFHLPASAMSQTYVTFIFSLSAHTEATLHLSVFINWNNGQLNPSYNHCGIVTGSLFLWPSFSPFLTTLLLLLKIGVLNLLHMFGKKGHIHKLLSVYLYLISPFSIQVTRVSAAYPFVIKRFVSAIFSQIT